MEQNGARPAFPLLQWLENEKRITGVRKGCRMQYMCRSDGIEHIMKKQKVNEVKARQLWDQYLQDTPPDQIIDDGPTEEPTMIPLAVEIYIDGHLDSQHEKVMSLKSKDQAIRGLAAIAEARQELERGHLGIRS